MTLEKVSRWIFRFLVLVLVFFMGYLVGDNSDDDLVLRVYEQTPPQAVQRELPEEITSVEGEIKYPIDLNTADALALESLPGIGPGLAQRILDYRAANGPFLDKIQIMDVSGIGEGKYAAIEQLITVKEAE